MNHEGFKTSLFIGLSILVTACSGGGGRSGNHASHTPPQTQPVKAKSQASTPSITSYQNERVDNSKSAKENTKQSSQPAMYPIHSASNMDQKVAQSSFSSQGQNRAGKRGQTTYQTRDSTDNHKNKMQLQANQSQLNKQEKNQETNVAKTLELQNPLADPTQLWTGQCVTSENCDDNFSDKINAYHVKYIENAKLTDSNPDKTTETLTTITLNSDKLSGDGYHFTLFGHNNSGYYGYRQRANNNQNGRHYDFLYAIKTEIKNNNELPTNYSANYSKEKGFIYSPLDSSAFSNNAILKTGDVNIVYINGKVTGDIVDSISTDRGNKIFTITGENRNLIIESTGTGPVEITKGEKGSITVDFIDSTPGKNDRKYLVGTGKSYPGSGSIGWIGVIFAEKKENK